MDLAIKKTKHLGKLLYHKFHGLTWFFYGHFGGVSPDDPWVHHRAPWVQRSLLLWWKSMVPAMPYGKGRGSAGTPFFGTVDGWNLAITWEVWNPISNGINYQSQLVNAGFQPSTVGDQVFFGDFGPMDFVGFSWIYTDACNRVGNLNMAFVKV